MICENLRVCPEYIEGTNEGAVENTRELPFMLSVVEAIIGLLSC